VAKLVLASGSPRRRALLEGLGLAFAVAPAELDERPLRDEKSEALVLRLSCAKATSASRRFPGALVIAADTVVVADGRTLGKPANKQENHRFIEYLAGRTHTVLTGHALAKGGLLETAAVSTRVTFRRLNHFEIDRYVETGEGLDKAGGYGIQSRGAAFVERIDGCYYNVMGLSLVSVVLLARRLDVDLV
jgi:septum formation protein